MYQVVTPNDKMMSAFQNVLYGKPDCWDVVSVHDTLEEADLAAKNFKGRTRIRLSDDINPSWSISDKYHISPEREPELAARIKADNDRYNAQWEE